jgi:uncharacterized membrane protein YozB (DUF420 family)
MPAFVAAIWIAILAGFLPDMIRHANSGEPAYRAIIHVHAIAFMAWLVLLSVQVVLVRSGRLATHRALGIAGAVLALAMIVLGPWAGIVSEQVHFGKPGGDPPFLAIEFIEMAQFALLVCAALAMRHDSPAHKRLMLLATLLLSTAGFGRWLAGPLYSLLGEGTGAFFVEFFAPALLLVLALGAYDLFTRRRLHPAYVAGATLGIAGYALASWLHDAPAWKTLSLRIIGH